MVCCHPGSSCVCGMTNTRTLRVCDASAAPAHLRRLSTQAAAPQRLTRMFSRAWTSVELAGPPSDGIASLHVQLHARCDRRRAHRGGTKLFVAYTCAHVTCVVQLASAWYPQPASCTRPRRGAGGAASSLMNSATILMNRVPLPCSSTLPRGTRVHAGSPLEID